MNKQYQIVYYVWVLLKKTPKLSVRAIARTLKINWRTANQAKKLVDLLKEEIEDHYINENNKRTATETEILP